jgi:hypothetical protein
MTTAQTRPGWPINRPSIDKDLAAKTVCDGLSVDPSTMTAALAVAVIERFGAVKLANLAKALGAAAATAQAQNVHYRVTP